MMATKPLKTITFEDGQEYYLQPDWGNVDGVPDEVIKSTNVATGNAITINPAEAPFAGMKLFGKTEQDGTPTPTEPKELKSVGDSGSFGVGVYGKNVLVNTATTTTANGITFTVNADKSINTSGTNTLAYSYRYTIGNFELPKGDYILTGNNSNGQNDFMLLQRGNGTLTQQWNGKEVAFSVTETETITVYYVVNTNATVSNKIFPMIRLATETDNTYEPCNKQSLQMPYTLRSVGDIKDEVDFNRGVLIQRCKELVIANTNDISYDTVHSRFAKYGLTGTNASDKRKISSHYVLGETGSEAIGGKDGNFSISHDIVYFKDTRFTNVTDLGNWLASNNVSFLYKLDTPIETPLTETELNAYRQLYTNKGNTTILSEADVEAEYYINQAVGNIHTQVNKDYFKLQQAIISLGGSTL